MGTHELQKIKKRKIKKQQRIKDTKITKKLVSSSFAFLRRNYLLDGRVNETVATVEELCDLWKPGAMGGIPPSVMNCNCI